MLNQERVCEMTKMAVFDQREGRECKPMIQYFRKDYISKEILKSFVTGTAAFCIIAVMWILYGAEKLVDQLNTMDIQGLVVNGILCYAVFMAVYFLVTYIVYHARYSRGRRKVKEYYGHLKKVNKLYRQEEQV